MKTRAAQRGAVTFVFIDTNPYRGASWDEVIPLLKPEQVDFLIGRNWTDAQKLRQAQDFAEENTQPSEE